MNSLYSEEEHIQTAPEGEAFGHHREYKYRVLSKTKEFVTHHTNSLEDARRWLQKCKDDWIKQDQI